MSTLSTVRNYLDGDDLTQSELDAAFDSIETVINGLIDSTNISSGGVGTNQLASSAVTAAKLATDACTTSKIQDGAVTGVKLDSGVVDNSTLAISSNQLIVKSGGVGTTQLADASVTQAKRAALGQQISSSSGNYSSNSSSFTAITNLSVTLTTTGRPVWVGLVSDGSANICSIGATGTNPNARFQIKEGSTVVAIAQLDGGSSNGIFAPVSSLNHIYVPSAGTYTYTVEGRLGSNTSFICAYAKLVAFEL